MCLLDIPPASFIPDAIKQWDYQLFSKINGEWHTPFLDAVLPFMRESYFWVPFYFFLLLFAVINFKWHGFYWGLVFAATALLADFVSSILIKENFLRLRPCDDPLLTGRIRILVSYCGGNSSFTSSHATTHFAAAMYLVTTFKKPVSPKWGFIFLWALVICWAQIYVGVHFPFDIFCGAIVGMILGFIMAKFFNNNIGLLPSPKMKT